MSSQGGEYTYKYPRPSVTVDTVIVAQPSAQEQHAQLLLIKRKNDPYEGCWALPGGFVDENEPLDKAAARELQEETSVNAAAQDILLTQVGAFGDPGRDPRGWCISVAYAALLPSTDAGVEAADDAAEASWYDVMSLPSLAFDHKLIVRTALRHLAKEDKVQAVEGLPDQLCKAADLIEGPWQQVQQKA
ncbi:hypothetical protein N2152v2_007236 [Parachlorella kessleri]